MKLINLFQNWKTDGFIFTKLETMGITFPWSEFFPSKELDILYMGKSGNKSTSMLLDMLTTTDGISDLDFELVSKTINYNYRDIWVKLYETLSMDYDALKPYNVTYSETDTLEANIHNNGTATITDNNTYDGVMVSEGNSSDTQSDNIYGFNSQSPVGRGQVNSSDERINRTTNGGTNKNTRNDIVNNTEEKTHTRNNSYTRSGNVGFVSNQDLIKQQRNIVKFNLFSHIFKDLDDVLTSPKYEI